MANSICFLADMCRLCLDSQGEYNILEYKSLIRDILEYTGLTDISPSDNLPNRVCDICLYRVNIARDLKIYTAKNDLYMRSLLNEDTEDNYRIAQPQIPLNISRTKGDSDEAIKVEDKTTTTKEKSKDEATINGKKRRKEKYENQQTTEQNIKLPKISVRSLEDINTSMNPVNLKQSVKPLKKRKSNSISSTESDRKKVRSSLSNEHEEQKEVAKDLKTLSSELNEIKERVKKSLQVDPNKCEKCQKTYPTAKKLYYHMRTHSKTLFCALDGCGKSFATNGDLQKHIRSHTGEKPYKCNLCDKSFTQNVTLRTHKDSVHVEKHT